MKLRAAAPRLGAATLLGALASGALAQSFSGLGLLPDGSSTFFPQAISGNGLVIVGYSLDVTEMYQNAVSWTRAGGYVYLAGLPGGRGNASAQGVDTDGGVIVGWCDNASYYSRAVRWTSDGAIVELGALPGDTISWGYAVSRDGFTVAGDSSPNNAVSRAFRWTAAGGLQDLGMVPGDIAAAPSAVSSNGSVVVGVAYSATSERAYRWTGAGGMTNLGTLGGVSSVASGVSDDGAIVVGWSDSPMGPRAFRWTSAQGMMSLGVLAGSAGSWAGSVSSDGSVVVGGSDSHAVVWRSGAGILDLNSYLPSLGIDLSGWYLTEALSVSASGLVIIGRGGHSGRTEGWIATIPSLCYANCDLSTAAPMLNINDFACFLNAFAVGQSLPPAEQLASYANCDHSTIAPVLNILDFQCFINRFAVGCS
jgi:probable HAF family extracellular repeat protein